MKTNMKQPAIYRIDNIPNVVKTNKTVTKEDIIKNGGNEFEALMNKWKDQNSSSTQASTISTNSNYSWWN